jgi:hypothetical protein
MLFARLGNSERNNARQSSKSISVLSTKKMSIDGQRSIASILDHILTSISMLVRSTHNLRLNSIRQKNALTMYTLLIESDIRRQE